jgi:hypothetical protein
VRFKSHQYPIFFGVATALAAFLAVSQPQSRPTGLESVRLSELQEKVTYLASRELKGRGNGSPELRVAAEYIARHFQRNGIKPAGDAEGYFQNFEMFRSRLGPGNEFSSERTTFRLGTDYVPHYLSPKGRVEGPLVFVGFGVSAPHLKFDEFAGLNLQGKIVLAIDRNPRLGDGESLFNRVHPSDFSSITTKARLAQEAGAVGLVIIQDSSGRNFPIGQLEDMFHPAYPRREAPMGNVSDPANPKIPVIIVSPNVGRSLVNGLQNLQRTIDETLKPLSQNLERRAVLRVDVERDTFKTQNVLGLVEGSHPQLRNEVLVLRAHYDHDGESDGDIWPGADDNASGTAGLMELAEAFGNGARPPSRSILLAAFAGEEKGEVGSQHYATHAVIPIERTVGMIQLDMIGRNEEHPANRRLGLDRETSEGNANSVNVIGSTFSPDLRRYIEDANKSVSLQLEFRYDDTAENLLRRSDQWPFLQKHIPVLFIHTGEHPDYHRPSDTADKINYPKLERIVRLIYMTVERVANGTPPKFVLNP